MNLGKLHDFLQDYKTQKDK